MRRGVNGLIALPFVALLFSNLYHAQIDPYWPALPGALAIVVVLPLAWSVRSTPGVARPGAMLTAIAVCTALCGYGATSVVDIQLDFSPGDVTAVPVTGKFVTHGRHSHSQAISTSQRGARCRGRTRSRCPRRPYQAVNVGDSVCLTLHPGAIGLPWFTSALCPELIVINSFSKSWAMTGWRLGWMTHPPSVGPTLAMMTQYTTSGVTTFLQHAGVAAIREGEPFVAWMRNYCEAGMGIVCDALERLPRVRMGPRPQAGMYAYFEIDSACL